MSKNHETRVFMGLFSLAGLIFCLANAMGADLLCVTEGCRIYQSYTFFGMNFYVFGALGFITILLLLVLPSRFPTGGLLCIVISTGLLIEILLLGYQFIFWPCSSCLVAALLFSLTAVMGIFTFIELQNSTVYTLAFLCLFFFLLATFSTAKEVAFRPWSIGSGDGKIQVYFSPTCPSCEGVVTNILVNYPHPNDVDYYPVAKDAEDIRRLAAALPLLGKPGNEKNVILALFKAGDPLRRKVELSFKDRFRLWCNKIQLSRMGLSTVPRVISSSPLEMPRPLPEEREPDPFFPGREDERCSPFGEEPCP